MYPIHAKDWDRYYNSILDHGLNVAVLVISARLFPGGFDVNADAPDSYEKLVQQFESGKRFIVYSGGSEKTIFGDPEVNYHFRAWHDWCHWQGRFDFSFGGEFATYKMQCKHLVAIYGEDDMTARWKKILFADVIGQRLHLERTGAFPADQMAFVRRFLSEQMGEQGYTLQEGCVASQTVRAAE